MAAFEESQLKNEKKMKINQLYLQSLSCGF